VPRPARLPLALAVLAIVAGALLLASGQDRGGREPTAPPTAGPPPGVTVGPAVGLRDGQLVGVRGAGLPSGLEILVAPCGRDALEQGRFGACDLDVAARTATDDDGAFAVGYRIARTIRVVGEDLDCATGHCVLSVIRSGANLVELAREPLSFDPVDPVVPSLVARPRSALSHRAPVEVRLEGLGDRVDVRQCLQGPELADPGGLRDPVDGATGAGDETGGSDRWCDPATGRTVTTEAGSAQLTVIALRVLVGPDGPLDCAAAWTECTLEVSDGATTVSTRLWFDPTLPLPGVPALVVEDGQGLADRQEVRLTVTELLAAEYGLSLCPATPAGVAGQGCEPVGTGSVRGPVGLAVLTLSLPRRIGDGNAPVDCARPPGCALRLAGPHPTEPGEAVAFAPVGFDPSLPLLLPMLDVRASGERFVVRALVAGEAVPALAICPPGADPSGDRCRPAGPGRRGPDGVWEWQVREDSASMPADCSEGCEAVVTADPAYPPAKAPLGR
jgi:hypothetical protein